MPAATAKKRKADPTPIALDAGRVHMIPVGRLKPDPNQPRRSIDEASLASLAASIRSVGVLQPITVRQTGKTVYIVSGERRWRAAKAAKLASVPCIVAGELSEDTFGRAAAQIAENVERENLSAMDVAEFLADLRSREKQSDNELLAALAKLGIEHVTQSRLDKLLRFVELPVWAKGLLRNGRLTEAHAVHLLQAVGHEEVMAYLHDAIDVDLSWKGSITVKELQKSIEEAYLEIGVDLNAKTGHVPEKRVRAFPIKTCEGCEHLKQIAGKSICLNPAEFDRKNAEALDAKAVRAAAKAKRAKSTGEDRDNPDPTKVSPRKLKVSAGGAIAYKRLQYDSYKTLSDAPFDVSGCDGCPHKQLASYSGDSVGAEDTCFHMPCFAAKARAGKLEERRGEKLEAYLDAWLRPRIIDCVPARASMQQMYGLMLWLATGALHRTEHYHVGTRHETAAQKTRAVLTKHRLDNFPAVMAFAEQAELTKVHQDDLARCAVAVMDAEQLRWFAKEIGFELAAEGYVIDEAYLALKRRAELVALGDRVGCPKSAKTPEIRTWLLEKNAAKTIGVPHDLAELYAQPYPPNDRRGDEEGDEAFGVGSLGDEGLAAALGLAD